MITLTNVIPDVLVCSYFCIGLANSTVFFCTHIWVVSDDFLGIKAGRFKNFLVFE